jgi:O-methyltransferase
VPQYTLKDAGWRLFVRLAVGNVLHKTTSALGLGLASFREPARIGSMRTVRELKKRLDMGVTPLEAVQLLWLVRATSGLGGSMAEVGVYRGGTARLIRKVDNSRHLHLFDTFTGVPEPSAEDRSILWGKAKKGRFAFPLEKAKSYFQDCAKVSFHPGFFPATGEAVKDEKFSFVHSDVGLYASTRAVLEFFYPRLLRGGILISHDFATGHGVRKAFEEFFAGRPEPVIELPGNQALVVKI